MSLHCTGDAAIRIAAILGDKRKTFLQLYHIILFCHAGRSNCIIIYSPCHAGRSNCILPVALGGQTVS